MGRPRGRDGGRRDLRQSSNSCGAATRRHAARRSDKQLPEHRRANRNADGAAPDRCFRVCVAPS